MSKCSIGFIDKNEMQGNVNDRPAAGCGGMHRRSLRTCAVILRHKVINGTLPLRTVINRKVPSLSSHVRRHQFPWWCCQETIEVQQICLIHTKHQNDWGTNTPRH